MIIPPDMREIGYLRMYKAIGLSRIQILPGSRLEKIGEGAFAGTLVREFVAPPSLREVRIAAFANCRNLERADLARTERVGDLCFWGTGLQQVRGKNVWQRPPSGTAPPAPARLVLPEGLRSVGRDWFSGSDIRELLVSQGVEEIQDRAFADCSCLRLVCAEDDCGICFSETGIPAFARVGPPPETAVGGARVWDLRTVREVAIPEGADKIGSYWFYGSDVESVAVPASVRQIKLEAFCGC